MALLWCGTLPWCCCAFLFDCYVCFPVNSGVEGSPCPRRPCQFTLLFHYVMRAFPCSPSLFQAVLRNPSISSVAFTGSLFYDYYVRTHASVFQLIIK